MSVRCKYCHRQVFSEARDTEDEYGIDRIVREIGRRCPDCNTPLENSGDFENC